MKEKLQKVVALTAALLMMGIAIVKAQGCDNAQPPEPVPVPKSPHPTADEGSKPAAQVKDPAEAEAPEAIKEPAPDAGGQFKNIVEPDPEFFPATKSGAVFRPTQNPAPMGIQGMPKQQSGKGFGDVGEIVE